MTIRPVVIDIHLPAGMAGPDPLDLDVRCFLVTHPTGITLIDTGTPGSCPAIAAALADLGATWTDVTDILLSHDIPTTLAASPTSPRRPRRPRSGATPHCARTLDDGDAVRGMTVLATPGHTAGHVSLLHDDGALLVGYWRWSPLRLRSRRTSASRRTMSRPGPYTDRHVARSRRADPGRSRRRPAWISERFRSRPSSVRVPCATVSGPRQRIVYESRMSPARPTPRTASSLP